MVMLSKRAQPNADLGPPHEGTSQAKSERKRMRTGERDTKLASAEQAKKKKKKQEEIQSRKPAIYDFNFVYIGNLLSTITTSLLEDFFKDCGQINRTIIRCSRGQAVMAGLAVPKEVLGPRDRQYASMEFMNSKSARKALAYHGKVLEGCQLVVSASAADLPEVQDIVQNRVASMQKQFIPMPPPSTPRRPFITYASTESFADYRDPRTDRNHILGFSFAKGVI